MGLERTELLKILREDFVSVSVYRNTVDDRVYYDVVLTRLSWIRQRDGSKKREWTRGANFKPDDVPKLLRLLRDAETVIEEAKASPVSKPNPDLSKLG